MQPYGQSLIACQWQTVRLRTDGNVGREGDSGGQRRPLKARRKEGKLYKVLIERADERYAQHLRSLKQ